MASKTGIFVVLLVAGLLLVSVSCTKSLVEPQPTPSPNSMPSTLRNLTDVEREKAIQIALNTPEAKEQIKQGITYKAELSWVAMVWEGSRAVEVWGLDYDVWEKGLPANVPRSAVIYPRVTLYFGEPEQLLVRVAVDLVDEKAVFVEVNPLKKLPSP